MTDQFGKATEWDHSGRARFLFEPESMPRPGLNPDKRSLLRSWPDRPAQPGELTFPELRHDIWLHGDAWDRLDRWPQLRKRFGLVLQHLAAHGRTTIVKGCGSGNPGWRRSPLGGSNGMHYYLWWTLRGSQAAKDLDLPGGAILVRSIRHHDEHEPLDAGQIGGYQRLAKPEELDDIADDPAWTDEQSRFVRDDSPVRLLHGRPGSGKTTALWKALEARSGDRVLYLTWSSDLARVARERFASFAPVDVHVETRDFSTFVGEIRGVDTPTLTLHASRARFRDTLARLGMDVAGPWARQRDALHAEMRAILFGRAIPGADGCISEGGVCRLGDRSYRELRGGYAGVGEKAAKALLKVARFFPGDGVRAVFPELVAAVEAIERLQGGVPEGFESFDRIVVDEAQDLTLVETAVVVELCRAIGLARRRGPWLLMAGDEGQTVRPTGFEWARLNDLLALRVGRPEKFQLGEHLRCPRRIAEVVDRASESYRGILKTRRPAKQKRQVAGEHVDAHLLHVQIGDPAEAVDLLEGLEEADGVVVVSPWDEPPEWVPERLRPSVLTTAQAKGLEYQSVCVLNPGRLLAFLRTGPGDNGGGSEVEQNLHRTVVDHLRVALSRATETLAFVDVETAETEKSSLRLMSTATGMPVEIGFRGGSALSRELLGDPAPYDAGDLLDHFARSEASAEERVQVRTEDARALIDSAPRRAWQLACQAIRLLGDPDLPNGVSDPAVREDARTALLATAARLMVDGVPDGMSREDLLAPAEEVLDSDDDSWQIERTAFYELEYWSRNRTEMPYLLLEAARELTGRSDAAGGTWLQGALLRAAQALRRAVEEGASDPDLGGAFAHADVETWFELTGYAGDSAAKAHTIRKRAFDTLIRAGGGDERPAERKKRLGSAESLLGAMPTDLRRLGRLREVQGRPGDAAEVYRQTSALRDELRVLRNAGLWERAAPLAEGDVQADLDWLLDLKKLVDRRPAGQNRRLREGERLRLEKLLDEVQKRPARKVAGRR